MEDRETSPSLVFFPSRSLVLHLYSASIVHAVSATNETSERRKTKKGNPTPRRNVSRLILSPDHSTALRHPWTTRAPHHPLRAASPHPGGFHASTATRDFR